jgi:hypothetical protein
MNTGFIWARLEKKLVRIVPARKMLEKGSALRSASMLYFVSIILEVFGRTNQLLGVAWYVGNARFFAQF